MKTQIEKLTALAKSFAYVCTKLKMKDGHNYLRGGYNKDNKYHTKGTMIDVYFDKCRKDWAVRFSDVEIRDYTDSITMPLDADEQYLEEVYASARNYFENNLLNSIMK